MTKEKLAEIRNGFETAYVDGTFSSNLAYTPQFVSNNYKEGKKVISTIENELLECEEFRARWPRRSYQSLIDFGNHRF